MILEIKDLVGLQKPLTRLIEVASAGVGAVCAPILIRAKASAKAAEIQRIAAAIGEITASENLQVSYIDGKVEIWRRPEDGTFILDEVGIDERTSLRCGYQARKKQHNLEKITSSAADELLDQDSVPDEKPDEDWISRFFSAAEDVSSDQMQLLWGKILAGEIVRPGSFSLKTLDFVRNLTKEDANQFERLAQLSINYGTLRGVAVAEPEWLKDHRGIKDGDLFELAELGVMYPTALTYRLSTASSQVGLVSGNQILDLAATESKPISDLPVWNFTSIGREMLGLTDVKGDIEYLTSLGRWFARKGVQVRLGPILERYSNGKVRFDASAITAGTPVLGDPPDMDSGTET